MNKDLDERIIPVGQFRDALNIQISTSEGSDVGTAQNILGNALVSPSLTTFGEINRCVGMLADEKNDVIYWFIYGDNKDGILEYHSDGTVTPVVIDINKDVLKFDFNDTITGINIIDDLIFWTDNRNEPRKINIKNCKEGTSNMNTHTKLYLDGTPVPEYDTLGAITTSILDLKEEHITVIKRKPDNAPRVIFSESILNPIFKLGSNNAPAGGPIDISTFNNGSLPFVGDIISMSHKSSFNHFQPFPLSVGDTVLLKRDSASGNLPLNYEIKAKIDSWTGGVAPWWGGIFGMAHFDLEILEIDNSIELGEAEQYKIVKKDDRETIFEHDFIRFATRYKYIDGEYSAFSPFTQPVFLAGAFGFHPTKDPYNVGMQNKTISIKVQDLIDDNTPKDVVQIDILFKKEDSTTVYSVNSIKWDDPPHAGSTVNYWNSIDYSNHAQLLPKTKGGAILNPGLQIGQMNTDFHNFTFTGYRGEYTITTENIHAALPENQTLRPWDNVPRKALAQEITGNRLIYGNYLQNYTLTDYIGNKIVPNVDVKWEGRNEDTSNYLYAGNTGKRSVKSNRTYQIGVVYGDEYGRETPVFTSVSGSQVVPVNLGDDTGFISAASSSLCLAARLMGPQPDWARYFKYYLKQTTGEYYNLTMDRVYKSTEDQNLWLSFPSSDRNKLKEGDYMSIKKEVEGSAVAVENKIKVIDIKAEAPKSIRFDYVSIGDGGGSQDDLAALFPNASATPAVDVKRLSIDKEQWVNGEYGADLDLLSPSTKLAVQFHITEGNTAIKSRQYRVAAWAREEAGVDGRWNLLLENTIHEADSWIEQSVGVLNYTDELTINIYEYQEKPAVEFEGRFFVKVISNPITQKYLTPHIGTVNDFQIVARAYAFHLADYGRTTNLYEQVQINGAATGSYGLYNCTYAWVGNTGAINGVSNGNPSSATRTRWGWHDVTKFNTDKRSNQGFFIDNMFVAAGQEEYELHGKWDAARSGRMFKGTTNITTADGNWWVNGLEGIVITSDNGGPYKTDTGARIWSKNKLWEDGATNDPVAEYDDTYEASITGYGATSGNSNEACFMHLSYSGVGVDLHDGNFTNWNMWGSLGSFSPTKDEYLFRKNLQWIKSTSIVLNNTTGSTFFQSLVSGLFGSGVSVGSGVDSNINSAGKSIPTGWNAAATEAHDNQFNPEWSGGASASSVIGRLATGNQFKFAGSDEIYTIKGVSTKFLYNHTTWNPVKEVTTTAAAWRGGPLNGSAASAEKSVSQCYQAWVDADYPGPGHTKTVALQNKIVDFGRANNRRVCYIIQLDKDPRVADTNFNPLNVADVDDFAAIQFIDEHIEPGQNTLPISPAVFETEAKEDVDLNIYYEVSDALPLELELTNNSNYPVNYLGSKLNPDSTRGHSWAPVGSKVLCSKQDSIPDFSILNSTYPNYNFCVRVAAWEGNIVTIASPGLRVNPLGSGAVFTDNQAGWDAQTGIYKGQILSFIRDDGSYTKAAIYEVREITENYITKIEVYPKVYNRHVGLPYYNCFTFGNGVESNRIRDDYNAPYVRHGVKASTVLEQPYEEERRKYGLIYSGLYNSTSGINNLNQFIQAEKITKDVLPAYGSIQKLYARNKDLVTLCEDKILQIMVDKDLLYNAGGNTQLTATNMFLGGAEPFRGNWGISKNPESFAAESFRAYFTDKQRGAVVRLSMDGLTAISDYGMHDWFRDNLRDGGRLYGSYDVHKRNYNLTISYPDGVNRLSNPDFDEGGTYTLGPSGSNLVSNSALSGYTSATTTPDLGLNTLLDGDMDSQSVAYYAANTSVVVSNSSYMGNPIAHIDITYVPQWLSDLVNDFINNNGPQPYVTGVNGVPITAPGLPILGVTNTWSMMRIWLTSATTSTPGAEIEISI